MSVLELINILKNYEETMQILICNKKNKDYYYLNASNFSNKKLYPDLNELDNSSSNSGELETYLVISDIV